MYEIDPIKLCWQYDHNLSSIFVAAVGSMIRFPAFVLFFCACMTYAELITRIFTMQHGVDLRIAESIYFIS